MSLQHFLVKKAYIYGNRDPNSLDECTYDLLKGFWIWDTNNEVLVKSNNPNRPIQITKKKDVETLDGQKGENL